MCGIISRGEFVAWVDALLWSSFSWSRILQLFTNSLIFIHLIYWVNKLFFVTCYAFTNILLCFGLSQLLVLLILPPSNLQCGVYVCMRGRGGCCTSLENAFLYLINTNRSFWFSIVVKKEEARIDIVLHDIAIVGCQFFLGYWTY